MNNDDSVCINETIRHSRRNATNHNERVFKREEDIVVVNKDKPAQQCTRVLEGFEMPIACTDSAITRFALNCTTIMPLNTLARSGVEPSMRHALVAQILKIIVHNPCVQNRSNVQTYSRPRGYGPIRPSSMPCIRLLLCRVFSESYRNLLIYLIESPSFNNNTNL